MHLLWLFIGILIGWMAAWMFVFRSSPDSLDSGTGSADTSSAFEQRRRVRHHVFRAVVSLVLIGVILTVWALAEAY